jgi:hypothetical protein
MWIQGAVRSCSAQPHEEAHATSSIACKITELARQSPLEPRELRPADRPAGAVQQRGTGALLAAGVGGLALPVERRVPHAPAVDNSEGRSADLS